MKLDMAGTEPDRPMILGNCISCNGLMRVPVTTDVTHVAKCPHCNVRFPVQQLIASAIPAAEIVDGAASEVVVPMVDRVKDKGDSSEEKPRTKFEVAKQLHDGAKHRRRRRRRRSSRSERATNERSRGGAGSGASRSVGADAGSERAGDSNGSPRTVDAASVPLASTESLASVEMAGGTVLKDRTSPAQKLTSDGSSPRRDTERRSSSQGVSGRRKRSRASEEDLPEGSVYEWLKICLGGMIAFPLAYLGLMWIAGLDPFGLSASLQTRAPVLVPPSLMVEEGDLPSTPTDDVDDVPFESDALPTPTIDPDEVRG